MLGQVEVLWNQAAPYRRAYTTQATFANVFEISHSEHRLLLDAIVRREPRDAHALLEVHIRRTRLALRTHPELFRDLRRTGADAPTPPDPRTMTQ